MIFFVRRGWIPCVINKPTEKHAACEGTEEIASHSISSACEHVQCVSQRLSCTGCVHLSPHEQQEGNSSQYSRSVTTRKLRSQPRSPTDTLLNIRVSVGPPRQNISTFPSQSLEGNAYPFILSLSACRLHGPKMSIR